MKLWSHAMTSGHGQKRNALASKACDGCRLRKVRCDMDPVQRNHAPDVPAASRCRRCTRLDLSCTFEIPSKHRGPIKRSRLVQTGAVSPVTSMSGAAESPSEEASFSESKTITSFPTDGLCTRSLLKQMLEDYLRYVYPLIPIVHRPSFRRDLLNDRDVEDKTFLSLEFAICAITIGLMPSRFSEYRAWHRGPPLRFETRQDMMDYCHQSIMRMRGTRYFDEINFQKLGISYLMAVAFFQLGDQNSSRMMEVEAMQIGRLLQVHQISEYAELNCIEAQLRKKGFWLLFYAYVHSELQNLRKERLSFLDPILLSSIHIEELLPLDVDDEFIFEDAVEMPSAPDTTGLTTSFIIHSRVFWAALLPTAPSGLSTGRSREEIRCVCRASGNHGAQAAHLRERLQELRYILDVLPERLLPWVSGPTRHVEPDTATPEVDEDLLDHQFAAMRANLHVTHLWLQSIIIDQLEAAVPDGPPDGMLTKREYWDRREEVSRSLLSLLHVIPEADIEPNGLHLTFKVRDVAAGLLNCPYEEGHAASMRAAEYIRQFTLILSRLDRSEMPNIVNKQSWIDTGRIRYARATLGPTSLSSAVGAGFDLSTRPNAEW